VDVPRNRISLTLRLDDEVPAAGEQRRPRQDRQGRQERQESQESQKRDDGGRSRPPRDGKGGGGTPRRPEPEPQGALAEALRRAGLAP
jgi:uncharacterized protein